MDINRAAATFSAMSLANVQGQASLALLRKTLDMQQASALQLLQTLPAPAPAPTGSVGGNVDIYA